jgi:hypothetical protein
MEERPEEILPSSRGRSTIITGSTAEADADETDPVPLLLLGGSAYCGLSILANL